MAVLVLVQVMLVMPEEMPARGMSRLWGLGWRAEIMGLEWSWL